MEVDGTMTEAQDSQPIVGILTRVAIELQDLAKSVDDLHCLVVDIEHVSVTQRRTFLSRGQTIDIVEQRLSSLSHFMTELVELMPSHWEVDGEAATRKLKLSALATRLSKKEAAQSVIAHMAGESEFF